MMMFLVSPCAIKYSSITSENQDFFFLIKGILLKFVVEKAELSFFCVSFYCQCCYIPTTSQFSVLVLKLIAIMCQLASY